jgi:hypothetical protein
MLARRNRHRTPSLAAVIGMAALAAATSSAAAAANAPAPSPPVSAAQPARPTPPTIAPERGRPFVPVQGDWEGTANGFTASFNLVLDAVQRRRAGVPQYGIEDLVMLRPVACPPDPAHYRESIVAGRLPSALAGHGALGLSRFGLTGGLTGTRAATLQAPYSLPFCHGTLTWHLHPAVRRTVANGTWMLRYSGGQPTTFRVQAGGRLATAIRLPASIASCNGLSGTLDGFIGTQGRSSITQAGVSLRLRFADAKATGTLTAAGCKAGPLRVTASHTGG